MNSSPAWHDAITRATQRTSIIRSNSGPKPRDDELCVLRILSEFVLQCLDRVDAEVLCNTRVESGRAIHPLRAAAAAS